MMVERSGLSCGFRVCVYAGGEENYSAKGLVARSPMGCW